MTSDLKSLIFPGILIVILVTNSCQGTRQDMLKGVWEAKVKQKNLFGADSIDWLQVMEFPGNNKILTSYKNSVSKEWIFCMAAYPSEDSMKLEQFKFIGRNSIEINVGKTAGRYLGITDTLTFHRGKRKIRPSGLFEDMYSEFIRWGKSLKIDTLNQSQVYYQFDMILDDNTTFDTIENKLQSFFNERMGSLPYMVKERQYSEKEHCLSSSYLWENNNIKCTADCNFIEKELNDRIKYNDVNRVVLKILTEKKQPV